MFLTEKQKEDIKCAAKLSLISVALQTINDYNNAVGPKEVLCLLEEIKMLRMVISGMRKETEALFRNETDEWEEKCEKLTINLL